jgi:predicted NAD/FAD-binding protein
MTPARRNIAIIGGGVSGLCAAFALYPHHNITLYEKNDYIGGHARTRILKHDDAEIAVDTGFIVYNDRNYPHLSALFRTLNVPTAETSMTFGVKAEDGSLEWGAQNLNALFAQRRNLFRPDFYRFLIDILRFNGNALRYRADPNLTLGQLIEKMGLGQWFRDFYILPMGGAIWSCPLDIMLDFPARFFIDFFDAHGLLTITQQPQWRTVTGGSKVYVDRLTASFRDRIRVGCGVASVTRDKDKIRIADTHHQTTEYDDVIFSCHGQEALQLLTDATTQEHTILGAFQRQENIAYLHKDTSLMPRRRTCWSSWIYHAHDKTENKAIGITYWMNKLQHIPERYPVFVTLNPPHDIAPEDIFDQHIFYHPIYDPQSVAAQEKMQAIQGDNNTWFCGAYTRFGFHEDGAASAYDIAQRMGVASPW